MPIGKFLLIRKRHALGAIQIKAITHDDQPQARSSEWIGTVSYESFFSKNNQPLASKLATHHAEELTFGRMKGFGFHYSWQSGNNRALVGPWKFSFFDPNGFLMGSVSFWNGADHDSGLEFAATNATAIDQIDAADKRLVWYRYDSNRNIPCPVTAPPIHKAQQLR